MPSNEQLNFSRLLTRLKADFKHLKFVAALDFYWSWQNNTIYYNPAQTEAEHLLLHELAHASLNHNSYSYDTELVQMELAAWQYSKQHFYPKYLGQFNHKLADDYLESYRNWLYERSLCPNCNSTGQQTINGHYICLACQQQWCANPAKRTMLKRRKLK